MIADRRRKTMISALLLVLTAGFAAAEAVANLAPPITRDALIHHLALPKIWIEHGAVIETPWADFSYYPMHVNLLYLGSLLLGSDTAPKFLHMGFALATGLLLLRFVDRRLGRPWGPLSLVVYVTTPLVVWLSTSAYIDLGMVFFTTLSLVALFRWREQGYPLRWWFFVSAAAMGLAVGSKYNALVAWMIVNLLATFLYVRETGRQVRGLWIGAVFFITAALFACPWYIRNWMLTGNPFYPLFQGVLGSLGDASLAGAIGEQLKAESEKLSFFQMRRVLYGESFLETLLIPLRMFFQGQDDSYRYFQGVLNPILVVFAPFAFFRRRHLVEKASLAAFSVIFVAVAFFTTEKQVRYLLPVLPALAILNTMGIAHLFEIAAGIRTGSLRRIGFGLLVGLTAVLLSFNVVYLKNRFERIDPLAVAVGKESRTEYLMRTLPHYPAVSWINQNLPADARIYTLFLGRRGYYLERAYRNDPSFGRRVVNAMVAAAADPKRFENVCRSLDATHLFIRMDLLNRYLEDNFSKEEIGRFVSRFRAAWRPVHQQGAYTVWQYLPGEAPRTRKNAE